MKLGIPVFDGVDLLDVTGPYEMFSWVDTNKGLESLIVSADGNPVWARNKVRFHAHASFAQAPVLDVVWVPGGDPEVLGKMMSDPDSPYFHYLRQVAKGAKWVCSVCEGALLAARAGLLDDHKATTHWAFIKCLQSFTKVRVVTDNPRFVVCGNRLTGGGISSGLDEALELISRLYDKKTAQAVQLATQYYPDPPVTGTIPDPPDCMVHWSEHSASSRG